MTPTLEDLLRPGLRAVVVGINPSSVSVAAGHYYQGRAGQRFFARLRAAGLLPAGDGFEDDIAFAAGIGFTDLVKRPTPRASDLDPSELTQGRAALIEKLERVRPELVIFTFKQSAEVLLGPFKGHGFLPDRRLGGIEVFVMPGPFAKSDDVDRALRALGDWWRRSP
jgi:TDG/mug DNA glycosylase family protein